MIGYDRLDERINDAVITLKRECQKAKIDCGVLALLGPKKGTDKELTELSFLCCHNNCGWFHLENYTMLNNCCHRWLTIHSAASYSSLVFLRCYFF